MIEAFDVDWQRLALNIRSAGVCAKEADRRIGRHLDFVSKLARGEINEPKFRDGISLLNLHLDVCGSDSTRELLR